MECARKLFDSADIVRDAILRRDWIAHRLRIPSRVVATDHTPIGIPRNVRVYRDPSGRIFDTIDLKLEEVEWPLSYARNANKPIPVASAITTKKANAPRPLTPMRSLNPVTQKTKSAYVPIHDLLNWRTRGPCHTSEGRIGFSLV